MEGKGKSGAAGQAAGAAICPSSGAFRMRTSLTILALLSASAVRADLIFLKDGTVLYGKTIQEATQFTDPFTKEVHAVKRGFFFIDDGARRFYFSPSQVQNVQADFLPNQDTVFSSRKVVLAQGFRLPSIIEVLETSPFDEKWNRTIRFRGPTREVFVPQHVQ